LRDGTKVANAASASETHLFILATETCSSSSGRIGINGEYIDETAACGVLSAPRFRILKIFGSSSPLTCA